MRILLAILFLWQAAAAQTVSVSSKPDQEQQHLLIMPGRLAVEWRFHDETRAWLSVNSYNHADWLHDGYDPSFTYILSQYRPVVVQSKNGQWQITFECSICGGLP
jgi:hypothetical protein